MTEHAMPDYNQITEHIWIGNNMCCMIHSSELLKHGFEVDIDLEDTRPEEPPHTKIYLWLPTVDHTPPSKQQIAVGVASLEAAVKANLRVYVHCHNGHGRAPTLVAAYLIKTGMDWQQAIELIKSKRPTIHLRDEQVNALKAYQESLNIEEL